MTTQRSAKPESSSNLYVVVAEACPDGHVDAWTAAVCSGFIRGCGPGRPRDRSTAMLSKIRNYQQGRHTQQRSQTPSGVG